MLFLRSFQLPQDAPVSLFSLHAQERLSCDYIMSDHIVTASRITVSFDFFAVHEIRSTLHMNHISVASSFFCSCFEFFQPRIDTSEWVQNITPGFFLCGWRCTYLGIPISFSENSFFLALFLMQFQCCCVHHPILKYPGI